MTIYDVVKKLTGYIQPVGATDADAERFDNLQEMMSLVELLLHDIETASAAASRPEASMKKIGEAAAEFMREIQSGPCETCEAEEDARWQADDMANRFNE